MADSAKNNDAGIDLLQSMRNYDDITERNQVLRQQMIEKILPHILKMDMTVDEDTDPDIYQGKSRFISEARQLLNDSDAAAKNHVAVKLKRTDMDQQRETAIDVAKILSMFKLNSPMQLPPSQQLSDDELATKLDERLADTDPILDTELEMGGNQLPVQVSDDD